MDVRVDEAWKQVSSRELDHLSAPVAVPDPGDHAPFDHDIHLLDLRGEHVHDASAHEQEVTGLVSPGHSEGSGQVQVAVPIDRAGIPLKDGARRVEIFS